MVSLIQLKYLCEGYISYEKQCLELLEKRGIGFYPHVKDIELILQVVKNIFDNSYKRTISEFDVNKDIPGCNIPYADKLIIQIDNDFVGSYGEYSVDKEIDTFNTNTNKFDIATIQLHIVPDNNGKFNESRYRQVIAHELVHLRDDYEIRKATNNEMSLIKQFTDENLDNDKVQFDANHKHPIANIIYRLFIDTEIHALGSQMYIDMYNLYKSDNTLKRSNAYKDMLKTETMQEYNIVKQQYIDQIKHNLTFANYAIKYFPKWNKKYLETYDKSVINKFKNWFIKIAEKQLSNVFNRITKASATLYDDIEPDFDEYRLYKLIQKKLKEKKQINESFNPLTYPSEFVNIILKDIHGENVKFKIIYNSIIE